MAVEVVELKRKEVEVELQMYLQEDKSASALALVLSWFRAPNYFPADAALKLGICTKKTEPKYPENATWTFYP